MKKNLYLMLFIEKAVKCGMSRVALLSIVLLLAMGGYAQSYCFTYEDGGKTIINGLTSMGEAADKLTIPSTVTAVRSGAFQYASSELTSLTVENGGNPAFESGLFGTTGTNTLTSIDMGNGMSVTNMIALLTSVGTPKGTIVASGFSGNKDIANETWSAVTWTNVSSVTLPAELVGSQKFGSADVYGRFNINKEIISFCTSATFLDDDQGSNQLFYVADGIEDDGRLHIQRVKYIAAGQGVLIHRSGSSSGYADVQRTGDIDDDNSQAKTDKALYNKNMLVGVTEATSIDATAGDYTNFVLKDGVFHRTTGGTIKANRAYLQIPTNKLAHAERVTISFDNNEAGINILTSAPTQREEGSGCYDLQGRKVTQPTKGIYIMNGKKHVIK